MRTRNVDDLFEELNREIRAHNVEFTGKRYFSHI